MLKSFLRRLALLLYRVDVRLTGASFNNAKTLVVANHESLMDGVLLWLFLPLNATFVVHTGVARHWLYRHLLKFIPHLPVSPTSPLAMKQVLRLVESGTPVVIFPEGRLTTTGALMKVYDGSAFIAAKTGATVIPVRIEGTNLSPFSRLTGIMPRKWFPKLSVTIQSPRVIKMAETGTAKTRRRAAGEDMARVLQESAVGAQARQTLFEAFLGALRTFGAKYPLIEDSRMLENPTLPVETYGSVLRTSLAVRRLAEPLTRKGECVGVLMPNAAPTVGLVLGLSAAARVPAMLNYTAGREGLQAACVAADIKTIFTSRTFLEKGKLTALVEGLDGITVFYAEDFKARLSLTDKLWIAAHLKMPSRAAVPTDAGSAAVVLFTSGSEGKPKGVVHTHASILSNVAQVRAMADFSPLDKFMVALPLFHSFGFTCGVILPLVSGYKIVLYPSPLHYRVVPEVVYDRNCTVLFGTSTFLGNYARFAHPYDFARLRYVVAGAEKLSETVRNTWFEKFGMRVMEGYGVTECAPVLAVNTRMAYRTGSVGRMVPGLEYRLEPVPGIDDGGLLVVKGPNVMAGYMKHEKPGQLQPTEHEGAAGWYNTGDIVSVDGEGFVFIRGRVKRFAKIAGEMVSLEVVEKLAQAVSPTFAHAAVAVPNEGKGEALVLFTTNGELSAKDLQAKAREIGVPELAVPRMVRVLEAIPVLGTGKTDYVKLNQLATAAPSTGKPDVIKPSEPALT